MQRRQLKRTLDTLNLELVEFTNGSGNSIDIRLRAPDGTTNKFQISRIDDPHSDKLNLNQIRHFARDHSHSLDLPGMVEVDIINITPKPASDMEVAVQATVLEHDPETRAYANRVYKRQPLVNPVGKLLSGASQPMPQPKAPEPVIQQEPEMAKPTLTLTTDMNKVRTPPKTIDRIGQVEFFKLCTVLNEIDMVGIDSYPKLAAKLTKAYGRKISVSTAEDAVKATGRKLDKVQVDATDAQVVIARTLMTLMVKIGESVPDDLRKLCGEIE